MQRPITYYYRGLIERGTGNGYRWTDGYSPNSADGLPTYPWNTKSECQQEAKAKGTKAIFIRDDAHKIA